MHATVAFLTYFSFYTCTWILLINKCLCWNKTSWVGEGINVFTYFTLLGLKLADLANFLNYGHHETDLHFDNEIKWTFQCHMIFLKTISAWL